MSMPQFMDNEYLKILDLAFQLEPNYGSSGGQTCQSFDGDSFEDDSKFTDPDVKIEYEDYLDCQASSEDSDAGQALTEGVGSFEKSRHEFVFRERKKATVEVPKMDLHSIKNIEEDKRHSEKCLPTNKRIVEVRNGSNYYKKAPGKKRRRKNITTKKYKSKNFFRCSLCNYVTYWKGHFTRHMAVRHSTNKYKCVECGYECRIQSQLTSHLLIHNDKIYECYHCTRKYKRLGDLQIHLRNHNSNTKEYKCPDCDYTCNRKSFLTRHSLVHTDIKLFRCPKCPYESKYKCNVKEHTLMHTNFKKLKCPDCSYRSNIKRNLERHVLVHTGEKLFKCKECDYKCNQRAQLMRHSASHSNAKLFRCSRCAYECNLKSQLDKHVLKTHK